MALQKGKSIIGDQDHRLQATRSHFDAQAQEYDAQHRPRPHYREMHQVLLRAIPQSPEKSIKVLELGVGTALLTEQILLRYPCCTLVGLELSGEMIGKARTRLAVYGNRVRIDEGDFATQIPKELFDVIITSLALHHLPLTGREGFYRLLIEHLAPEGALIIGDRVKPPTELLSTRYRAIRQREMVELGWTEEEVAKERGSRPNRGRLVGTNHGPSTLEQLLGFLSGAGLNHVDCLWKQGTEAVIYGEKDS